MQKLFYTVALLALPLLAMAQTELKINADARGRSCNGGLGICGVSGGAELKNSTQDYKTTAIKLDTTTLVLKFNSNLLSVAEQRSLLNRTLTETNSSQTIEFIQEENLIINKETLLLLGFDPKFNTIKKGIYPMAITDDTIIITLKLWEQ